MRIAYVCNEYPPVPHGGIGTFTRTIARGMTEAGHEITVVGYGRDIGERYDHGVRVVTLPECKIRGIAWLVNRRRLYRWLRCRTTEGELDIIEIPEFGGLLPFPFERSTLVVRLHQSATAISNQTGLPIRPMTKWCEVKTLQNHRNWIGVSHYVMKVTEQLFKVRPSRSIVIHNPVPTHEAASIDSFDSPRRFVLYVGTVSEFKGAYILAEACRTVLSERKDLHLVYAGAMPNSNGVRPEQRVASILGGDLMRRVHFLGRLDHSAVLEWMRRAAVVALPSRLEAFSLVPLEAMAAGIPVMYTTAASGPEVIEDGVTGFLADPYSADDISHKLALILDNPQLARHLVENALRLVRHKFSVEKCVDDTLAFYEECLATRMRVNL